jgi:hypothetical protein
MEYSLIYFPQVTLCCLGRKMDQTLFLCNSPRVLTLMSVLFELRAFKVMFLFTLVHSYHCISYNHAPFVLETWALQFISTLDFEC